MIRRAVCSAVLALLILTQCQCGGKDEDLFKAVTAKSAEKAGKALSRGCSANAKDDYGTTVLSMVAASGDEEGEEMVKLFIEKGADVNAPNCYGRTPLHQVKTNESAELLIAKGADVKAAEGLLGLTPLHWAASDNRHEVVGVLLDKGADVNAKNKNGATPLHLAASRNSKEAAELLIEKGADKGATDGSGNTPMHRAAKCGQKDVLQLLLEKGADRAARNSGKQTPEDCAHGAAKDVFLFLKALPVVLADDVGKAGALLGETFSINHTDKDGCTLLHHAAKENKRKIVEFLIVEKDADVNVQNAVEQTPLDLATDSAVKALLKKNKAKTGEEIKKEKEEEEAKKKAEEAKK